MVIPDLTDVLRSLLDETATTAPPGGCLVAGRTESAQPYAAGYRQVFGDDGPLTDPLPMTAATAHDLGSVTKLVGTTATVMTLVDRGELALADPLHRYLDAWPRTGPAAAITIAHLLEHRAGLWEWWPTYLGATDAAGALDLVAGLPLRYRPDTGRHYSDLGFMLLGQIVQLTAARALDAAVSDLVSEPLALKGLRFGHPQRGTPVTAGAPGDAVERHMIETGTPYPVTGSVAAFAGWRARVRVGEVDDGNAYHSFGGVAGHAGLFGTAADLMGFGRHVLESLSGDGYWRQPTVRRFLTVGADPGQAVGFRQWTVHDGERDVHAYGHTGFPGVAVAVVPAHDLVVALLTNRLHVTAPPPPPPFEPGWLKVLTSAAAAARSGRLT